MIWYKAWLESRTRFLVAGTVIIAVLGWAIFDAEQSMKRFDSHPPITYGLYVWFVLIGRFQPMWVVSIMILGLGGLMRERSLGTAQYTLTLPVSRRQWMVARAGLGLAESAALAIIPAIVIPIMSQVIGHSYPMIEALKFSVLALGTGIVFFCVGFFFSSLVQNDIAAGAMSGIVMFFVFNAQDYLYRWLPRFSMSNLITGGDFVNRVTGFLMGWPSSEVFKSICVAGILLVAATQITERRDF